MPVLQTTQQANLTLTLSFFFFCFKLAHMFRVGLDKRVHKRNRAASEGCYFLWGNMVSGEMDSHTYMNYTNKHTQRPIWCSTHTHGSDTRLTVECSLILQQRSNLLLKCLCLHCGVIWHGDELQHQPPTHTHTHTPRFTAARQIRSLISWSKTVWAVCVRSKMWFSVTVGTASTPCLMGDRRWKREDSATCCFSLRGRRLHFFLVQA